MKSSSQVFTSFLFSFLIIVAGVFIIFSPVADVWRRLGEARMQLAERQTTVQRLKELIAKFREQVALFDDLNQQTVAISDALPSSLKIPEILVSLESIAKQNNILIKRISFTVLESRSASAVETTGFTNFSATQPKQNQEPFPISVQVDASGNYPSGKAFLKGIEDELRLMDVRNFEFIPTRVGESSSKQENNQSLFNMKLSIDVYSIKKPQFTLP
ncbi:MAG: hypothetical protein A2391_02810 [Candidatus Brennerbacteria bacterium RIFOXYB1_FULL_41_13]|uniref:Uncharacterized protein n=1 Tax=Candidatus Brennerbacteria bacterium RIFOXYD1_FULL_41_16 TaxID=1797529 RepID=A0A1G1XL16_9BACT|nr:MAG: hypothetical protein A2391_02810 [Candidatus Brennerbacteria bacterium RIFOXYB1_FULL_41_13]OGY40007.1 MAG: hypothetical protein A2570_00760 [Candidatus Brennerbacteria bacterium RIFOXYD1_FULL_41_16]